MSLFWTRLKETLCDHDDSVWSNLAYPAAALSAPSVLGALSVALTGANLALWSGVYHHYYDDRAARRDVWAMLVYLVGVSAVSISFLTGSGAYVLPLMAGIVYWRWTPRDAFLRDLNVGGWALVALGFGALEVGYWILVPALIFLGSVFIRRVLESDSDGWRHSLWHFLGGISVWALLFLL